MSARVALVTGGTGGIGTAICQRLAGLGHKVATNYRNEEKARAWERKMRDDGLRRRPGQGRRLHAGRRRSASCARSRRSSGPVDILINNAGITRDTTFHKMTAASSGWRSSTPTSIRSTT